MLRGGGRVADTGNTEGGLWREGRSLLGRGCAGMEVEETRTRINMRLRSLTFWGPGLPDLSDGSFVISIYSSWVVNRTIIPEAFFLLHHRKGQ